VQILQKELDSRGKPKLDAENAENAEAFIAIYFTAEFAEKTINLSALGDLSGEALKRYFGLIVVKIISVCS
jgi:hypothetical protein